MRFAAVLGVFALAASPATARPRAHDTQRIDLRCASLDVHDHAPGPLGGSKAI